MSCQSKVRVLNILATVSAIRLTDIQEVYRSLKSAANSFKMMKHTLKLAVGCLDLVKDYCGGGKLEELGHP